MINEKKKYLKYKKKYLDQKLMGGSFLYSGYKYIINYLFPHRRTTEKVFKPLFIDSNKISEDDLLRPMKKYKTYYNFAEKMVLDLFKLGYIFNRYLGKGGSGLAIEFIDPDGILVSIKGIFENKVKYAELGIKISKYLQEKINICQQDSKFILIYKYLGKINNIHYFYSEALDSDLVDFLNRLQNIKFMKKELLKTICMQLINAIYCLHKIGVIYGDMKPDNIFIRYSENKFLLKLSDFDGIGYKNEKVRLITKKYALFTIKSVSEFEMADDIFVLGLIIIHLYNLNLGLILVRTNEKFRDNNESIEKKKSLWNELVTPFYTQKINDDSNIPIKLKPFLIRSLSLDKKVRPKAKDFKELIKSLK